MSPYRTPAPVPPPDPPKPTHFTEEARERFITKYLETRVGRLALMSSMRVPLQIAVEDRRAGRGYAYSLLLLTYDRIRERASADELSCPLWLQLKSHVEAYRALQ